MFSAFWASVCINSALSLFGIVLAALSSCCDSVKMCLITMAATYVTRGQSLFPPPWAPFISAAAETVAHFTQPDMPSTLSCTHPSLSLLIHSSHISSLSGCLISSHIKLLLSLRFVLDSGEWIFLTLIIRWSAGRAVLPAAAFSIWSWFTADFGEDDGNAERSCSVRRECRVCERKRKRKEHDKSCLAKFPHMYCPVWIKRLWFQLRAEEWQRLWLLNRRRQQWETLPGALPGHCRGVDVPGLTQQGGFWPPAREI